MFRLRGGNGVDSLRRAGFEFVVIVMGVLVALAGDQWRQDQEDARELSGYLASVLSEVQANLRTVRRIRTSLTVLKIPALETVIAYLESGDTTADDPHELMRALALSAWSADPWFTRSRFDALKNSGHLRQLGDAELADEMSGTFQAPQVLLDQVDAMQGDYPVVVNEIIPATEQPELNLMRGYTWGDAKPPAVAIDISLAEAIDLMNQDRERLRRLARGEAAVATAKWYALLRIEGQFSELEKALAKRLGVELPPEQP
jgi:hypothetical protein